MSLQLTVLYEMQRKQGEASQQEPPASEYQLNRPHLRLARPLHAPHSVECKSQLFKTSEPLPLAKPHLAQALLS